MLKKFAVVLYALLMAFGGLILAAYAGADDAPGGVLLGIVVILGAGALGVLGVQRVSTR